MGALSAFGRGLFVAIFIVAGIMRVQYPSELSREFISRYRVLHSKVLGPNSPRFLQPAKIHTWGNMYMTLLGISLIASGLLVLLGYRPASLVISGFLLTTILITHNPLLSKNDEEYTEDISQLLINIGLLGCSFLLGGLSKRRKSHSKNSAKFGSPSSGTSSPEKKTLWWLTLYIILLAE